MKFLSQSRLKAQFAALNEFTLIPFSINCSLHFPSEPVTFQLAPPKAKTVISVSIFSEFSKIKSPFSFQPTHFLLSLNSTSFDFINAIIFLRTSLGLTPC